MTGMGTSPYPTQQSPSFHSISYIPKLEASFMRDFMCCERVFPTMHDLLQHYEENHAGGMTSTSSKNFTSHMASIQAGSQRPSSGRPALSNSTMGNAPSASHAMQVGGQLAQGNRQGGMVAGASLSGGMGGIQQMMRQQQQQQQHQQHQQPHHSAAASQKHSSMSQMNDEMDAVGEMEMDEPVGPMDMDDSHRTMQQTAGMFGQQRPQLHLNSSSIAAHQGLRTSTPTTPHGATFGFGHNPTVSSVNTPTLTTQHGFSRQQASFHGLQSPSDDDMSGLPMKMDMGGLNFDAASILSGALGTSGIDLACIDDPANRLLTPGGGPKIAPQTPQTIQQQFAQLGIDPSQLPPGTDHSLLLQQMNLIMQPDEDKPFKCPVIGCEKAYKNQNGLKYVAFF